MLKAIKVYISTFPESTRQKLWKFYHIIQLEARQAEESISYDMPTFKSNRKPLVYFAGYKNHIEFYATLTGHGAFKDELSEDKHGKGSVQLHLNEPLTEELLLLELRKTKKNRIRFIHE